MSTADHSASLEKTEGVDDHSSHGREEARRADRQDADWSDGTVAADETLPGTGRASKSTSEIQLLDAGAHIDRYLVIHKLGAGAMGVVYAAYDPKLDRKLALKLLAKLGGQRTELARERLRREAQSLAKLAHPNVVGVYDVDVHEGQLYVAMEFVAGQTLGAWMREHDGPRPWRAVLDTFMAAGRGLAAAHATGLIHRDFKPDNAMIGEDGRVRVMDFGIARTDDARPQTEELRASLPDKLDPGALGNSLTRTGAMMGTPAYMALEQFEGKADARSDQFGFCVALYEALYDARPFVAETLPELLGALATGTVEPAPRGSTVPAWLRAVVVRGLAADPEQRWPSMDALLEALADDPGQRRRRWARGALTVALVAGVGGGLLWSANHQVQACAGFEAKLAGVWDAETKARVEAAFEGTELAYAEASFRGAAQRLDDYTQQWLGARQEACEATQRGEQSGELLDLRMACLDERLEHVRVTVELLEVPDADIVKRAVEAAASLPQQNRCSDIEALKAERPPPEDPEVAARVEALDVQLIKVETLQYLGKFEDALRLVTEVVEEAEGLGYEPLQVRAWLFQGNLLDFTGAYAKAEDSLKLAYASALALTMMPQVADAASRLVWVVGYQQARYAEGLRWEEHAGPIARAAGTSRAKLTFANNLGVVAHAAGMLEKARTHHEEALAIQERQGPDHPAYYDITGTLNNLSNVAYSEGKYEEARSYGERALAIQQSVVGPDHPDVAASLNNLGAVVYAEGNIEDARGYYERALAIWEKVLGPEHPDVAASLNNLGVVVYAEGNNEDARAYHERALAIWEKQGPEHPDVAMSLNNLGEVAIDDGKYEEARGYLERSLALREKGLGPDHSDVASSLRNLGSLAHAEGKHEEARAYYERVLAIWEKGLGPDHPKLVNPLTGLGKALLGLERPEEALPFLERALSLRTTGSAAPVLLAQTRFALARALWDMPTEAGRDRPRAHKLAESVAATYEAEGAKSADALAEVRAWQADRSP